MRPYLLISFFFIPFIALGQHTNVDFVPQNTEGFILPDTLEVFNKDLTHKSFQNIPGLEKIKILSVTGKKYYLPHDSNECKEANFLEILYKNSRLIVSGKDAYETDSQRPLYDISTNSSNGGKYHYELYSATNFAVGATDSIGLTFCDDYSILILRRLPDHAYSLIETTDSHFRYSVLCHDDAEYDSISSIASSGDTIILKIGAQAQTGTESYKLKIVYNETLCKAVMTDMIIQTGGKYYDKDGNEIKQ